ncbi:MAG: division plane positioning ATPase MipZ [Neomegalonema sp.]|nr:division plane positioning ATPase MipZ [Neomegalonema sp.]
MTQLFSAPAHFITIGNKKGGSSKTTTAITIAVALERIGKRAVIIDLDPGQNSAQRYLANRSAELPSPAVEIIRAQETDDRRTHRAGLYLAVIKATNEIMERHEPDFVIFDCPGDYSHQADLAHSAADTLITSINASMIEFPLLAEQDERGTYTRPGSYARRVAECRHARADMALAEPQRWHVIVNQYDPRARLELPPSRTAPAFWQRLALITERLGCELHAGLSLRAAARDLFLSGLTVLDLEPTTPSIEAAQLEARTMLAALKLPGITQTRKAA